MASKIRIIVTLLVIALCIGVYFYYPYYLEKNGRDTRYFGGDFQIYWIGVGGEWNQNFLPDSLLTIGAPPGEAYIYPNWTKIFFHPLLYFNYKTAWHIWYVIISLSLVILSYKLMKEFNYGWIVILPLLRIYTWSLLSLNVNPLFFLLLASVEGTLLVCCFKLWGFGFLGIHALKQLGAGKLVKHNWLSGKLGNNHTDHALIPRFLQKKKG